MNNEINEILDIEKYRNKNGYVENINLLPSEIHKLLDYITNLQEENKKLETTLNAWAEAAKDEEKRKYEFMGRNKKAIEYIFNTLCDSKAMVRKDISGKEIDNLIHILEGSDKE